MNYSSYPFSFEEWVQRVFDHPVTSPEWYWCEEAGSLEPPPATTVPEWYWCEEAGSLEPPPATTVAYLTNLFQNSTTVLQPYSDEQLNQGFWYLISGSSHARALLDDSVSWSERQKCIQSIPDLFRLLFAKRCTAHLSDLDEKGAGPLNSICYMWWDSFPTWGQPKKPEFRETDAELLAAMRRILSLDSLPCQENALHGLGHWQMHYPDQVGEIIDEFLKGRSMREELRRYAGWARGGYVQ